MFQAIAYFAEERTTYSMVKGIRVPISKTVNYTLFDDGTVLMSHNGTRIDRFPLKEARPDIVEGLRVSAANFGYNVNDFVPYLASFGVENEVRP